MDEHNVPEHIRQAERVIDELADTPSPEQIERLQHGRGFGRTVRQGLIQVERPVRLTNRTQSQQRAFCRTSAGLVVWRGVPSWHQKREPNSAAASWSATQSPPWVRKRKARAKTKLAKVSRKANR